MFCECSEKQKIGFWCIVCHKMIKENAEQYWSANSWSMTFKDEFIKRHTRKM